jgi:conjugative relaxase-like TrwC/TraI family protein
VLSIGAMTSGQGEYYLSLGREDYYTKGGEPPGRWFGKGASDLELAGRVDPETLRNLFAGYDRNGFALIQNAGKDNHQPGWDLTFSAPKSLSVMWSQADQETRKLIEKCHTQAVNQAVSLLEDEIGLTRRGRAGERDEKAHLVFAAFDHGTSRAQDPQLHTHVLLMNIGVRQDGTTGTIVSQPFYDWKLTGGALYRAELTRQLATQLGLEFERVGTCFDVKGVDQKLMHEFSKRREEILAELAHSGRSGAVAASIAALETRAVKGHVARERLFEMWQETGAAFGFSQAEVAKLIGKTTQETKGHEPDKFASVSEAVDELTKSQSFFSRRELIRRTAEAAQTKAIGAEAVFVAVDEAIEKQRQVIHLGKRKEEQFTTREMLHLEEKLLSQVESSRKFSHSLSGNTVSITADLSAEQKVALAHILERQGAIKVIQGMAGTGKTTLLNEARHTWEASGYEVIGAAFTGKAARGLAEGAQIKSDTLHKTLADIEKGNLQIHDKSVLILDEAGMIGTRQMSRVVEEVVKSGSRLVLVGDSKQLQAVDAGSPFRVIGERLGYAELTDIKRQRDARDREAIKNITQGESNKALQSFAERGLLTITEDRTQAIEAVITDWQKEGIKKPQEALIITGLRVEAATLNRKGQMARMEAGELGDNKLYVNGQTIFENDRILFMRNSRLYGVGNGTFATVEKIDETRASLTARLDNGERVSVNTAYYDHIKLGYAATTHKGQGMTVERAFVLAGGQMQDRELSYVQASRARGETRIYAERAETGEDFSTLTKEMKRSRQKEMAVEVIKSQDEPQVGSVDDPTKRQLGQRNARERTP